MRRKTIFLFVLTDDLYLRRSWWILRHRVLWPQLCVCGNPARPLLDHPRREVSTVLNSAFVGTRLGLCWIILEERSVLSSTLRLWGPGSASAGSSSKRGQYCPQLCVCGDPARPLLDHPRGEVSIGLNSALYENPTRPLLDHPRGEGSIGLNSALYESPTRPLLDHPRREVSTGLNSAFMVTRLSLCWIILEERSVLASTLRLWGPGSASAGSSSRRGQC
jgi:hypothetical protein